MRISRSITASLIAASLVLIPATAMARVKITRAYYDSPGSDTGSNSSLNAEYIVIKNTGDRAKRLRGWVLKDTASHDYRFGTFRLGAGNAVRVHTGSGNSDRNDRYWGSGAYVWNNDGDTAILKKRNGTTADRCSWNGGSRYKDC
jgi:Lamin Tail Domain